MVVYGLDNNLKALRQARYSKNKSCPKRNAALLFAALLLIPLFLAGSVNSAAATEWVVKRVSGIVYFVAPNVEAFRAKKGMVFKKGYTMGTRAGGRALIVRGEESISVGPNTTFAISKYQSNRSKTTLLQRKGKVTVDVTRRSRPHFFVETPFLAAVVKGTRFEVNVNSKRTRVSVARGVVEVQDFSSGDKADLSAGQNASSARSNGSGLAVGGRTKPAVRKGPKRAAKPGLAVASTAPQAGQPATTQQQPTARKRGFFEALFSGGRVGNVDSGWESSDNSSGNNQSSNTNSSGNGGSSSSGSGSSGGGAGSGGGSGSGGSGGGGTGPSGGSGGGGGSGGSGGFGGGGGGFGGGDDDDDDDDGDDDDGDDDDDD